jgi:hypothetical protein
LLLVWLGKMMLMVRLHLIAAFAILFAYNGAHRTLRLPLVLLHLIMNWRKWTREWRNKIYFICFYYKLCLCLLWMMG